MKSSVELKQERSAVSDKIDALKKLDSLTNEQTAEMRTLIDQESKSSNEIELALELEKREAEKARNFGKDPNDGLKPEEREQSNFSFAKLIREASNKATNGKITGFEAEMIQESAKEARNLGLEYGGIYLSNDLISINQKRAMTAGTLADGGYFIPTEKVGFFDALYAKTVMAQLGAPTMTGLSANTDLPGFSSGVSVVWETEVSSNDATTPTTANRTLRPKRLGACSTISKQLLIQTNGSVEGYLLQSYMRALAAALEAAYINGSGSAPTGILGTSGTTTVSIGANGGALTYAKMLELISTMEQANVGTDSLKWLTNAKVVSKAKQTPIVSGQAAMLMSYQNYYQGSPNQMDGRQVLTTSNVPSNLTKGSTGTNLSALILGDWGNNSMIGQFGGLDIVIDPYTSAKTAEIEVVVNQFVDIALKLPATFGTIEDITT